MKTLIRILGGVIVLAVVAIVGWHYYQMHRARQAGLLTENITHDGDMWKADFTARVTQINAQIQSLLAIEA